MNTGSRTGWASAYRDLAARLPAIAQTAPLTLCGMSACVDARLHMGDITPLLGATEPSEAVALASMLRGRAARGTGGEVRVDWEEGPAWLTARLRPRYALGGIGPQAAWVLTTLGAPAVAALEDRSAHMLARLPPGMLVAEGGALVRAEDVTPRGGRRPDIFIFEFTAGEPVGDVVPTRASRVIVRFNDPGLEHDPEFDRQTPCLAAEAGAGLVAGFNCVPAGRLGEEIGRVFGLTRRWSAAGLSPIHLEMSGGYGDPADRDRVLDAAVARGGVTSLGMSGSEFRELAMGADDDDDDLAPAMVALGERLGVDRLCVHADHWAASATRGDPAVEREALMAGCLLASARSAAGRPVAPDGVHPAAEFHAPPFAPHERGGWSLVACASPYLRRPATTLGLGDTFTAGCLLVLGAAARQGETE